MHTVGYSSENAQIIYEASTNIEFTFTPYKSIKSEYDIFNNQIQQLEVSANVLEEDLNIIERKLTETFSHGGDLYWECIIRIENLKAKWKFIQKNEPAAKPDISYPLSIEYMDDALLELQFNAFFDIGRTARKWIKEQLNMKGITHFQSEDDLLRVTNEMLVKYEAVWKECLMPENELQWFSTLTRFGFDRRLVDEQKLYRIWVSSDKSNVCTLNQLQVCLRKIIQKENLINERAISVLLIHPFMRSITPSLYIV